MVQIDSKYNLLFLSLVLGVKFDLTILMYFLFFLFFFERFSHMNSKQTFILDSVCQSCLAKAFFMTLFDHIRPSVSLISVHSVQYEFYLKSLTTKIWSYLCVYVCMIVCYQSFLVHSQSNASDMFAVANNLSPLTLEWLWWWPSRLGDFVVMVLFGCVHVRSMQIHTV